MGKKFETIEERRLYIRNHQRVARRRGRAAEHTCRCGAQAKEWAQLHERDGSQDEHFEAMCHRCHHKYDDRWNEDERTRVAASVKASWDQHHNRQFTEDHRAALSASQEARHERERGGRRV